MFLDKNCFICNLISRFGTTFLLIVIVFGFPLLFGDTFLIVFGLDFLIVTFGVLFRRFLAVLIFLEDDFAGGGVVFFNVFELFLLVEDFAFILSFGVDSTF